MPAAPKDPFSINYGSPEVRAQLIKVVLRLRYQRPEDMGPLMCVPVACRHQVLEAEHSGHVLVGHSGVTCTTAEVSR